MRDILRIWATLLLILGEQICLGYRILLIIPIPSGSHVILGDAIVKTLLEGGHEVVYVTAIPKRIKPHPNFVEVDVSSNKKYFATNVVNLTNILENDVGSFGSLYFLDQLTFYSVHIVKHESVEEVLYDKKFDLVIAEWMFSEIYAGLPALLDCPLIWFSSMEPHGMVLSLVDELPNTAHSVEFGENNVPPFSFFGRVKLLGIQMFNTAYRELYIYFKETEEFNSLFEPMMEKKGKKLPSYAELRFNASLVLSNSHVSLGEATRLPQNFISIGGYHIDPEVIPLPEDIEKIMNAAKHGVIYFSMGSILKSTDFPKNLKMELLKMFGGLKQTVLWKFEDDIPEVPPNVHILKWASQQSILAHPNCILFITHGGLLSITESIHFATPIIGIPVFADQFINVRRAKSKGFAKEVTLSFDLAKDMESAIKEVLSNPQYKEKINELSFAYHKRPTSPRKELIHWVEYVIETRGARLLRSPAIDVPFYQKYYLDLVILILLLLVILRRITKWLISKLLWSSTKTKKLSDKKVK